MKCSVWVYYDDIGQCLGEPSIHQQSNKHALDYEGHSCKQRQKSPTYAPILIPKANKINLYNHRSTFLIYLFFSSHPILDTNRYHSILSELVGHETTKIGHIF